MLRNGTNQTINTKHMCITAMKQYENKSLEVCIQNASALSASNNSNFL